MKPMLAAAALCLVVAAAACAKEARPALHLEGNRLTIYNGSDDTWEDVQVFLNHHFRIEPDDIPPAGVVQAPLDIFVAGYGQRFNFKTMQITDLRLKATRHGEPFELRYEFQKGGLQGALGGFKGRE
jgi:hypothetical protein